MKIKSLLYADDLVLISKSEAGLQKAVSGLQTFCKDWDMEINPNKTKVVVFNHKDELVNASIKFGKHDIQSVNNYKYLGMLFQKNGNFTM